MAYLPELHRCCACGIDLGPDDGDGICGGCDVEEITIISGGQSGVDQAALHAARACGLPTRGYAPKGWETEDGPAPQLRYYGLVECETPGYPARTRANVEWADATLLLVDGIIGYGSKGSQLVKRLTGELGKPLIVADLNRSPDARQLASDIVALDAKVLNVAGNRESSRPGIGAAAERLLVEVFTLLKEKA